MATVATTDNITAAITVGISLNNIVKSTIMPTLIKKNGMKMAFPTKSMRFINGERLGINLFKEIPARKAPTMYSIPASLARNAPMNTMPSTKIYCATLSLYRLKNHLPTSGNMKPKTKRNIVRPTAKRIQNCAVNSPFTISTTTAKTNKASTVVIMVPATDMLTERVDETP